MKKEKYSLKKIFSLLDLRHLSIQFLTTIRKTTQWRSKIDESSIPLILQNHRASLKLKLKIQPLKNTTFLSLLPFFVGFWYFVQQKYPFKKTYLFFEKTLPGLSIPTEKLHWETLQYLLKYNKTTSASHIFKALFSSNTKIYWDESNVIIQNKKETELNNQDFVAWISRNENPINFQLSSKKNKYILLLHQKDSNNVYDYLDEFDEIPTKLQSSYTRNSINWENFILPFQEIKASNEYLDLSNNLLKSLISQLKINFGPETLHKFKLLPTAPNQFNFLVALSPQNSTNIVFQNSKLHERINQNTKKLSQAIEDPREIMESKIHAIKAIDSQATQRVSEIQDGFQLSLQTATKKQKEIFTNFNFLNQEIRKLFINTGLLPVFSTNSGDFNYRYSKIFQGSLSKSEELKILQDLLVDIDQISLPGELNGVRSMSGYRYPDMNSNEICWFLVHKHFFNVKNIKLILPPSYSISHKFMVPHFELPKFLIKSQNFTLKNSTENEILYQGPGIPLNMKTGLDWYFIPSNKTFYDLNSWVRNYLRINNPVSDSLQNFFGVIESPENASSSQKLTRSSNNYWSKNLPLYRTGIITNTSPSFIPFERSFLVPFLSNQENQIDNQNLETNTGTINTEKPIQFSEHPFPIFETRLPTYQNINYHFGLNSALDYGFAHPVLFFTPPLRSQKHNFIQKNTIESAFLPAFSSFLAEESFGTQLSSGVYKKVPSVFLEKSAFFFSDLWEPLTYRSWLVVSQMGFAFLVFRILKALADNYGRELLVYLLDLVALLGFLDEDLKQEIEILMGQREKGFRIIKKTTKNFTDIAGIQNLLPEVVELVWFLRNSGREFLLSKTLPRGVLLTGPAGTGKTLLVQALAGEAEVPVLALSGSSLLEPGESGALKLEILFQEARLLAPCIVFIDEMDTLAQKREQVLQNPMGVDEVLESFQETNSLRPAENSIYDENGNDLTESLLAQQDMQREKLRILMQFLVELDGIQGRDGVVVIGATNRPEMLDPAILRPGRFDRVLELGLPGPEKRRDILKLYSQNLGVEKNISWNYLTHRTAGYSAADLASIMNQSSLRAIMTQTSHTVETIEHGIDRITTVGTESNGITDSSIFDLHWIKEKLTQEPLNTRTKSSSNLSTLRVAYYQAGKTLLSVLLEHHPPTLVIHLWPRRTNVRALQIASNLQKYFFRFARRIELEHRVIGCYAGKAAEILLLQSASFESHLSDFGTEDIQFGQNLIDCMIKKWYFYSKNTTTITPIITNKNVKEYSDSQEKIVFFNQALDNIELPNYQQSHEFSSSSAINQTSFTDEMEFEGNQQLQSYFPVAWWQYQVANEFEIATRHFSDWYRLYLPDPQQNDRNLEWIPPDEFYHGNNLLENLTGSTNWNDISEIRLEYQMHSLVLQSFNKALVLLDQNREVLDKLAFELMHFGILREPEIKEIVKKYSLYTSLEINKKELIDNNQKSSKSKKIVNADWGNDSRKKTCQWIDLNSI